MDVNLLPVGRRPSGPVIGVALTGAQAVYADALAWAQALGFGGVELAATGEPGTFHAPSITPDERDALQGRLSAFAGVAAVAPSQDTFDITLVSPSSVIRRASVSELWSVCRFLHVVAPSERGGVVVVRTGVSPMGLWQGREATHLSESLTTLDRVAGEQGAVIGLLNRDAFRQLSDFDPIEALRLQRTGFALDITAAIDSGETGATLARWVGQHAGRIAHIRVADDAPPHVRGPLAESLASIGYTRMVCLLPSNEATLAPALAWWVDALLPHGREEYDDITG